MSTMHCLVALANTCATACATTLPSARALVYTAPSVPVKHTGFGDPFHSRRSSRATFGQRLFYAHALRMAHMAYLFGGPCGDTREGVPVPTAGSPTPHGLPPSFGDEVWQVSNLFSRSLYG